MEMATAKVKVSGFLYFPWVLVTSASGQSKFTAMVRVKAPPLEQSRSDSIRLVVVLHVGGRMDRAGTSSEEPRLDLLQMMEFIRRHIGDATTVVDPFQNSSSRIPIDDWISAQKGQKKAKKGTSALTIKEILELAVKKLESDGKLVGSILLLSDAHSEFKCESSDKLYKSLEKLPVHAFGLGNENPEVMHRIAQISKGTYSSITGTGDLLNSEITKAIALCLGGLKTVVAVDACVDIKVNIKEPNSIIIKDLEMKIQYRGHNKRCSPPSTNSRNFVSDSISVGVLYAGEVKDLIVHVYFTSKPVDNARTKLAELTAKVYKDSSHKQGPDDSYMLPLLVTKTSNGDVVKAYEDIKELLPCRMVLQQMIRFDVLKVLVNFLKKKQGNNLGEALQSKWDELREGERFQMAQKMDLLDLGGIGNDMDAMVRCLNEGGSGGGLRSIYSWVSSYRMQRFATTGLLRPATAFLTTEMEEMVIRHDREKKEMVETARKQQLAKEWHTKSKYAIGLFDRVEKLLGWSKRYPTTTKAPSSSGGANDESQKLVVDFIQSLIYEAVDLVVNQWRRTTPRKAVHSTPAAPPPPVEGGDDPTVVDANKPRCAIELLDKIDKLLNLSKTCGASDESQKRVDGPIRRLIYEVTAVTIDEWWRATSGAPTPPVEDEGTAKSKHARVAKLLDWSSVFPATGGDDDVPRKCVDDLIARLICEDTAVHNDTPPAESPPVKTKYTTGKPSHKM
ncbi:unnamed protein product [Urochloa humidicola]